MKENQQKKFSYCCCVRPGRQNKVRHDWKSRAALLQSTYIHQNVVKKDLNIIYSFSPFIFLSFFDWSSKPRSNWNKLVLPVYVSTWLVVLNMIFNPGWKPVSFFLIKNKFSIHSESKKFFFFVGKEKRFPYFFKREWWRLDGWITRTGPPALHLVALRSQIREKEKNYKIFDETSTIKWHQNA